MLFGPGLRKETLRARWVVTVRNRAVYGVSFLSMSGRKKVQKKEEKTKTEKKMTIAFPTLFPLHLFPLSPHPSFPLSPTCKRSKKTLERFKAYSVSSSCVAGVRLSTLEPVTCAGAMLIFSVFFQLLHTPLPKER